MIIGVPAFNPGGLDAELCHHFGRTENFTVVKIENNKIGEIKIVYPPEQHSCSGIVQSLIDEQVDAVILGGIGGRPFEFFRQGGVEIFQGTEGTVRNAIEAFIEGKLQQLGTSHC